MKWDEASRQLKSRIRLAVSWLLSNQDPSGSWDSRGPWLAGVVIQTLVQARAHVDEYENEIALAVARGIDWLVGPDVIIELPHGDLAWDPNLGTWDSAIILRALIAANYQDTAVLTRVKNWLLDQNQRWFGATTVPFGESYPAQTLLALEETKENFYINSRDIGRRFRDSQAADGSWGDHFNTAEVLQYLALHRDGNQHAIKRAVSYIERTQAPNGTWGSLTWPTAITLMAYIQMANDPYKLATVRALEYLVGQQHENGSWFHLIADTAFATQAICRAIEQLDFSRFAKSAVSDFIVSNISVIESLASSRGPARGLRSRTTVQIDYRIFAAMRLGLLLIGAYLMYSLFVILRPGWSTLSSQQQFDLVFKAIVAVVSSIVGLIVSPLADWLKKRLGPQRARYSRERR